MTTTMEWQPQQTKRWTAWLVRLLLTVHGAMVVAQPVLIGRYLDGDFDWLSAHRLNGSLLPAIAMLCVGATLAHWLIGRGQLWLVVATVLLIPIEGLQLGAGYAHNLAVHIPLGTSIVALALFLAAWSWTPRLRRARAPFRRPDGTLPNTPLVHSGSAVSGNAE
jgi:hypothetical protein